MLLAVLASCHVWLSAVQGPTDTLRIYAVGDINLGRNLGRTVLARGDTLYPFRALADTLRAADLTFGNLESPIVAGTRGLWEPVYWRYICPPPTSCEAGKSIWIDPATGAWAIGPDGSGGCSQINY